MKTVIALIAIIALAFASGESFTYNSNGSDWTGTCSTGTEQSPIDIPADPTCKADHTFAVTWKDQAYSDVAKVTPTNTSGAHNIQVNVETSSIDITPAGGTKSTYVAAQFHIHAPSEHKVGGKQYDVEIHFVHQKTGGTELAVLGLLFDLNAAAPDATSKYFFDASRLNSGAFETNLSTFNPSSALKDILTANTEYYFYDGSLTTPPCTEGVKWTILKNPLPITQAQLDAVKAYFADNNSFAGGNGNNREVQPVNQRTIYLGGKSECPAGSGSSASSVLQLAFIAVGLVLFTLF